MNLAFKFLHFLGAHSTRILAVGIFLGLAWPQLARWAAPLLVPSVVVLMITAMVRQDVEAVVLHIKRPGRVALALLWTMGLAPIAMAVLVGLFRLPADLATVLVLAAAGPSVTSSITFALIFRLDAAIAVILMTLGMILAPLTLPPMALALLCLELQIDLLEFMLRLGLLIGGAVAAAIVVRRLVPRDALERNGKLIDGVAVLVLMIFAVGIMAGVQATLIERPGFVALTTLVAFLANIGLQALGAAAFWWMGARAALAIGLVSGNRNLGVLMAALGAAASPDMVLFFALGQLPIYMLPWLLRPLYQRLREDSPVARPD